MKCPKCGYLGFEPVDRCRNCGYDFSLTQSLADVDLLLRTEAPESRPFDDFSLAPQPGRGPADQAPAASSSTELPLFSSSIPDDQPLITRPSPPRVPLAVRRATPHEPRGRADSPRRDTLEFDVDVSGPGFTPLSAAQADVENWPAPGADAAADAGLVSRFAAVLIDLFILLAVDTIVVYFTMQICGLSLAEVDALPKGPLFAFLIVQNGGYLVAFTAGGQTLGKMAAGIKVVTDGSGSPLDLGRAIVRTVVWVILAVPAGLGFLTALFSRDHRGLHDRFARSRVVRASA
jgi:uncharacterized RDD family membrane protein YckC